MVAFLDTFKTIPVKNEIPSEDDYYQREEMAVAHLFEQSLEEIYRIPKEAVLEYLGKT